MGTRNRIIAAIGTICMLWGCDVKDPIYETDHPEKGKITLTTDWSGIGADKPSEYIVAYTDMTWTAKEDEYIVPNLFDEGSYTLYLYNETAAIPVTGTQANVRTAETPSGAEGTFIDNYPGWLFTGRLQADVKKATDHEFTVKMARQVVEMTFTVTPSGGSAERIESIAGRLGGVAGAMNLDNGKRSAASNIAFDFAKQPDGTWKATVRLLGIVGDSQPLTTIVKFTGGNPGDVEDTTDIHDEIDDNFGDGGEPKEPGGTDPDIDLGTEIIETPTETGFTATIKPWEKKTGSGVAD